MHEALSLVYEALSYKSETSPGAASGGIRQRTGAYGSCYPPCMLTYAHVCARMLTYAHASSRMLTSGDGKPLAALLGGGGGAVTRALLLGALLLGILLALLQTRFLTRWTRT